MDPHVVELQRTWGSPHATGVASRRRGHRASTDRGAGWNGGARDGSAMHAWPGRDR